jgi:hypothetical protein
LAGQIRKLPLPRLVDDTAAVIERHYIKAALELTAGSRRRFPGPRPLESHARSAGVTAAMAKH